MDNNIKLIYTNNKLDLNPIQNISSMHEMKCKSFFKRKGFRC